MGTDTGIADGIDVGKARADTPGCIEVAHLNNAGAALPPSVVTDAVIDHLRLEARIGGYEAAAREAARVEGTYEALARLVGCRPAEIALVENATRAWDMAFYAMPFAPGDRILTGRAEYASNVIAMLQVAARTGAQVEVVDDGMGIPIEAQAKVFKMFEQVSDNLSRAQGGLGIGLALVQKLVALHGGHVEAYSEGSDRGSTFTVASVSAASVP